MGIYKPKPSTILITTIAIVVTVKKLFVISKAQNKKIHPSVAKFYSNSIFRKAHGVVRHPPPPQLNLFLIQIQIHIILLSIKGKSYCFKSLQSNLTKI